MTASKMKAVINRAYGLPKNLDIENVDIPEIGPKEVLIQVKASTVTKADTMMRMGIPKFSRLFMGIKRPKNRFIGTGFSGTIVKVGKEVTQFKVGENVFGEAGLNFGANAEFLKMNENGVMLHKPENLSHAEASTLTDGFLTSYNFLISLAKIRSGQKLLVIGASGSLGTAAIQLASILDVQVTGISSNKNKTLVLDLGASHHIDYHEEDFTKNGMQYDVIFDTIGASSFHHSKHSLKSNGIYLSPVLTFRLLINTIISKFFRSKKAIFSATGLLEANKLKNMLSQIQRFFDTENIQVVIDRSYTLEEIREAHQYVDSNRKVGNVILEI